jgi:hypothetical protein
MTAEAGKGAFRFKPLPSSSGTGEGNGGGSGVSVDCSVGKEVVRRVAESMGGKVPVDTVQ